MPYFFTSTPNLKYTYTILFFNQFNIVPALSCLVLTLHMISCNNEHPCFVYSSGLVIPGSLGSTLVLQQFITRYPEVFVRVELLLQRTIVI